MPKKYNVHEKHIFVRGNHLQVFYEVQKIVVSGSYFNKCVL